MRPSGASRTNSVPPPEGGAAVQRRQLPLELHDVAELHGRSPLAEGKAAGGDELVVGDRHALFERRMTAGLKHRVEEAERRRPVADVFGWVQDLPAVLGPQSAHASAALFGVGLVPQRHVALGEFSWIWHGFASAVGYRLGNAGSGW